MQFEFNSLLMMSPAFGKPRQFGRCRKLLKAIATFDTAPVIAIESRQHDITKGQLRLREIAPDEIALLGSEFAVVQKFPGKEQAGATVEQQPRGFAQRNILRLEVMFAAGKHGRT